MVPVVSSNLAAVGYDPMSAEMQIRFNSGGLYSYAGVPASIHAGLMSAPSHGEYFSAFIRGRYGDRRIS